MIENVFLDAGGVLLDERDHEAVLAEIIVEIIDSHNPWYTKAHYRADVDDAVHSYAPRVYNYILWKNIADIHRYREAIEILEEEWESRKPPLELADELHEVLPLLAGRYRLGILGQYGRELIVELEREGLLSHFTFTHTQEVSALTKPDPRYFELVLAKAGVPAEKSLMVGDRIDKDIVPAKQTGMKTMCIRTGMHKNQRARTPDEEPDYTCESIAGMVPILC